MKLFNPVWNNLYKPILGAGVKHFHRGALDGSVAIIQAHKWVKTQNGISQCSLCATVPAHSLGFSRAVLQTDNILLCVPRSLKLFTPKTQHYFFFSVLVHHPTDQSTAFQYQQLNTRKHN